LEFLAKLPDLVSKGAEAPEYIRFGPAVPSIVSHADSSNAASGHCSAAPIRVGIRDTRTNRPRDWLESYGLSDRTDGRVSSEWELSAFDTRFAEILQRNV